MPLHPGMAVFFEDLPARSRSRLTYDSRVESCGSADSHSTAGNRQTLERIEILWPRGKCVRRIECVIRAESAAESENRAELSPEIFVAIADDLRLEGLRATRIAEADSHGWINAGEHGGFVFARNCVLKPATKFEEVRSSWSFVNRPQYRSDTRAGPYARIRSGSALCGCA